jgi:hypothetical protein
MAAAAEAPDACWIGGPGEHSTGHADILFLLIRAWEEVRRERVSFPVPDMMMQPEFKTGVVPAP